MADYASLIRPTGYAKIAINAQACPYVRFASSRGLRRYRAHVKIDEACTADDIFQRYITNRRKYPAVGGIVAVIAQHEDLAIRYLVNSRVVVETVVDAIERLMAHAVQKRFAPALGSVAITCPARLATFDIRQPLPHDRHAIDEEQPLPHLNGVTG